MSNQQEVLIHTIMKQWNKRAKYALYKFDDCEHVAIVEAASGCVTIIEGGYNVEDNLSHKFMFTDDYLIRWLPKRMSLQEAREKYPEEFI